MQIRDSFHGELFGPLINIMRSGIESGELKDESPEMLTLIYLGTINNFIGKAAEMNTRNSILAAKLTSYFLEGAKNLMNPQIIPVFESVFNILYLTSVWYIVFLMSRTLPFVNTQDRKSAGLIRIAFIMLAAGDTGHVGFRVLANLLKGSGAQAVVFGTPMSLIGLGMMTTAYTVTIFYMLFVYVWQARFNQPANWLTNLVLTAGVIRLIFMALPGNNWGSPIPPQPMSIYRNLPLLIQGAGVVALILLSASRVEDKTFRWIGWMIISSFAFYIPVILFSQSLPAIGMLMIPKTCAYLAVAWIAYRKLWYPSGFENNGSIPASTAP